MNVRKLFLWLVALHLSGLFMIDGVGDVDQTTDDAHPGVRFQIASGKRNFGLEDRVLRLSPWFDPVSHDQRYGRLIEVEQGVQQTVAARGDLPHITCAKQFGPS